MSLAERDGLRRLPVRAEVEPGRFADLVAVPGDPLADSKLMTNVTFVMKAGKVYKP
ncbi:MAG: hypothetical protein PSV13_14390 [Lacunisphaera sp.]|nr:hypothetical protein [Lacunisphaera sp.]